MRLLFLSRFAMSKPANSPNQHRIYINHKATNNIFLLSDKPVHLNTKIFTLLRGPPPHAIRHKHPQICSIKIEKANGKLLHQNELVSCRFVFSRMLNMNELPAMDYPRGFVSSKINTCRLWLQD